MTKIDREQVASVRPIVDDVHKGFENHLKQSLGNAVVYSDVVTRILYETAKKARAVGLAASGAAVLWAVAEKILDEGAPEAATIEEEAQEPESPAPTDDRTGLNDDDTPWTDQQWADAGETMGLTPYGRNQDGSEMTEKQRRKAGLSR